jgi:hypothetical protein
MFPLLSSKTEWTKHQLRMFPVGGSKRSPHLQRYKFAKSGVSADVWLRFLFWKDKAQRQSVIGLPKIWHTLVALRGRTPITQWCKIIFLYQTFINLISLWSSIDNMECCDCSLKYASVLSVWLSAHAPTLLGWFSCLLNILSVAYLICVERLIAGLLLNTELENM